MFGDGCRVEKWVSNLFIYLFFVLERKRRASCQVTRVAKVYTGVGGLSGLEGGEKIKKVAREKKTRWGLARVRGGSSAVWAH